MAQTYESWYSSTLAAKLAAWDNTMIVATAPTVTAGRLFLKSWTQKERISFTWVSWNTLTWLTRWLSQTDIPTTSWSGMNRVAWTVVKLVAMHDQLPDMQWDNTWNGTNTFTEEMSFTNISDLNVNWTSNPRPVVADTTIRDTLYPTPVTWDTVYVEALNALQIYNTWTAQWETQDVWTPPVDASTTAKGIVEEAIPSEVWAWTWAWATGARLFINPTWTKKTSSGSADENYIPVLNALGKLANWFIWSLWDFAFGDWSDWDVTISSNTTLTRDMYYNNLTIDNAKTLYPNWYKIFVKWTLLNNGTISHNGNNGSNWTNWTWNDAGWVGWAAVNWWTLNAWVAWVTWQSTQNWYWGWDTRTVLTPSSYITYSNNNGANAWTSWSNGWTTTGWVSNRWINYNVLFDFEKMIFYMLWMWSFNTLQYKISWQAMWWGGGGVSSWSAINLGSWWGWWSSWWLIWIAAKIFNNAWTIIATWWNGWNGWTLWWSWFGWGWGWGWHWGFLFLVRTTLTNLWTVTLTWGTWWARWEWWTAPWVAGSNWSNWATIQTII
jgi:hypothetical protein